MNHIRSNGNLAWITLWPNVQKNSKISIVYHEFEDPWSWTLLLAVLAWNIRRVNESVIFWDQSWISLDCRFVFNDSLRVEFSSIFWHLIILYKVSSSMDLERISTKDISPENFKGASVDVTRHKFGLTWKFYVHSGTSKWIFHSHGSYVHLRQPTSKGSCMWKPFNRIP